MVLAYFQEESAPGWAEFKVNGEGGLGREIPWDTEQDKGGPRGERVWYEEQRWPIGYVNTLRSGSVISLHRITVEKLCLFRGNAESYVSEVRNNASTEHLFLQKLNKTTLVTVLRG